MGIGAAIWAGISAISAFATSSIVGGVIVGACIGAAVGGLTALVTGGDIGKGILFGAIGGAVTGGLASWAGGAGSTVIAPYTSGAGQVLGSTANAAGQTAIQAGMSTAGSIMANGGTEVLGSVVAEGMKIMSAEDVEPLYKDSQEYLDKKLANDLEQQRIASANSGGSGGGGSGHDPANMANVRLEREKWKYGINKSEEQAAQRTAAMREVRKMGPSHANAPAPTNTASVSTIAQQQAHKDAVADPNAPQITAQMIPPNAMSSPDAAGNEQTYPLPSQYNTGGAR